ncbi:peptidoglycan DD-metalloendopeptidase family protein [Novosphingobium rosa]|uniref:peptidoglycan DD-metalloendopeptidase family protein n=1 Tax=Novosphingobium rosa TaxID=76978 RepID=UPI000835592E|nr:M23 family metallopeptidase [Novosphingobium rosa]
MRALPLLAAALVIAAPAFAAPEKTPAKKPKAEAKGESDVPLDREHVHMVKPGETLGGIAHRAKVPRILIIEANGIKPPYDVHAGQRLMLPRTRRHTVKEGETGFDIAYRYGVPLSSILVANGLKDGTKLDVGQSLLIPTMLSSGKQPAAPADDKPAKKDKPAAESDAADTPSPREAKADHGDGGSAKAAPRFSWPLNGPVRRGYTARGKPNFHDGLDIVAPEGSAARAVASGTVLFAKEEPDSFGRLVVIDHGNGWQSAYGFLSKITVKEGDPVKAHERVGLVGHSGKATRDELHFEIRQDNHPVDPAGLLPKHLAEKKVDEKVAAKKVVKKK